MPARTPSVTPPSPRTRPRRARRLRALLVVGIAALVTGASGCAGAVAGADSGPPTDTARPAPTTPVDTTPAAPSPPDPARRVLVLGDSTMVDVAPALLAAFGAAGSEVVDASRPGVGLSRFGFREGPWSPESEWSAIVDAERPDLTIVMLGVWDMPTIDRDGLAAYVEPTRRAMAVLARAGRVLWLSTPTEPGRPDWPTDQVFEAVAATFPSVSYAEVDAAVRAPDGTYPPSFVALDGSVVRLRKDDGFHFCADGAERLADEVNRLAVVHGLARRTPAGWEDGAWRASERYDDPACLG